LTGLLFFLFNSVASVKYLFGLDVAEEDLAVDSSLTNDHDSWNDRQTNPSATVGFLDVDDVDAEAEGEVS